MPKTALSGTRIRALRNARGVAQRDLAQMAGISASYLNLIEHNRRRAGPALLAAIAEALAVPAVTLAEDEGARIAEALLRAATAAASAGPPPELERVEEFAGRFPGWAALLESLHARSEAQERSIEMLADRMAHDPNLSAALHEIVSAVTAVQSTAAILAETDDLDPEWRARFHRNIHADSVRLATAAEALVAYLDSASAETGLAAPQEEVESWLSRHDFTLPAIEAGGEGDLAALTEGQAELASGAARQMARDWLAQARADAAALPLDALGARLSAMFAAGDGPGFAPDVLAADFGVPLGQLFRRLASLPPLPGVPRFGLVVCDGSGALIFRRPIEGFAVPRFGGACPVWPLYQALLQPGRPLRAELEMAGRPAHRFIAHAIAAPPGSPRFEAPFVVHSSMLLCPAPPDRVGNPEALVPVGSSCRVCPRLACAARREPSIVAA